MSSNTKHLVVGFGLGLLTCYLYKRSNMGSRNSA